MILKQRVLYITANLKSTECRWEELPGNDMKVHGAALATSAAPIWLPEFVKPETRTRYSDGTFYQNGPGSAAFNEKDVLWPSVEDERNPLDFLLCLGTGRQASDSGIRAGSHDF
ncbi:hypothetical protein MKZ38_004345 [Zalerion maritima]|uniref:PNPLA domain-containing protein n=1 Tax=Zalerion maritima TaxID=339359 RepID=A0AAD5RMC2_9PEZI|nr:hypothetical protein MKZ38_004345 [Zalerion maritima]